MSTITVKDGTNPIRPLDYELEGHTLSPLISCSYSNETSEIRKKAQVLDPSWTQDMGRIPQDGTAFSAHLGEKLSRASFECAGKRILFLHPPSMVLQKGRRLLLPVATVASVLLQPDFVAKGAQVAFTGRDQKTLDEERRRKASFDSF